MAKLSMTVIRMTIFIAPQSPSVVMNAHFWIPKLFSNDLYVSQNRPFKLHRLCAISHTQYNCRVYCRDGSSLRYLGGLVCAVADSRICVC